MSAVRPGHDGTLAATYLTKIKTMSKTAWEGSGGLNSNALAGSLCEVMAREWIYAALDAGTRATWLSDFDAWSTFWENDRNQDSPYNDVTYIRGDLLAMPLAIAQYLDGGAVGLRHLRFAMDYYINYIFPVWRQRWGPGSPNDSTTDGGGCWHEQWPEYMDQPFGMVHHIGPNMLSWAQFTNNYPGFFTTDNPWVANIAYCLVYQQRPDFTLERINDHSGGGPIYSEYTGVGRAAPGTLETVASAFNRPSLRWIARMVDWRNGIVPYGFEPAGFPYLAPDSSANTSTSPASASLPLVRNFNNYAIFGRTGWTEDDSFFSLRCQDHFWSKDFQENGGITAYSRGSLIIRSGGGRPGTASQYVNLYSGRLISQSAFLALDGTATSGDYYPDETIPIIRADGSITNMAAPNEGGGRAIGSGWNQQSSIAQLMQSPYDLPMWQRARELYKACEVVAFNTQPKYTYAAIDDTLQYNNQWSHTPHTTAWKYDQANTVNRSYRVQNHKRHVVWIPRGKSAIMLVFDQAITANPGIVKKVVFHTIEQPTVSGNHITISRNRTATVKGEPSYYNLVPPSSGQWNWGSTHCGACTGSYTYSGAADIWETIGGNVPYSGATPTPCLVGGAGHEADIGAICNPNGTVASYGTNWAEASIGQIDGPSQAFYGYNNDQSNFVRPDQTFGMQEPGSWRVEETVGANHTDDWFLNVALIRDVADTAIVLTTAPVTTDLGNGHLSTTMKYNTDLCTITVVLPKYGIAVPGIDTITATGTCPAPTGGTI
jgi:hypothetical protein